MAAFEMKSTKPSKLTVQKANFCAIGGLIPKLKKASSKAADQRKWRTWIAIGWLAYFDTQYIGLQTEKAKVLSTYALCGFANIGSIGIFLGAMVTLLPQRRADLTSMIVYGMIGGNIACFLTGCFSGNATIKKSVFHTMTFW